MALSWYNGFSPQQRERGDKWIKEAIDYGELKPLKQVPCSICGQDKGIRHYHCEDYSSYETVVGGAIPVCWMCHMMIHRKPKHPKSAERYFERIKAGERFDPVYLGNEWFRLDQFNAD